MAVFCRWCNFPSEASLAVIWVDRDQESVIIVMLIRWKYMFWIEVSEQANHFCNKQFTNQRKLSQLGAKLFNKETNEIR